MLLEAHQAHRIRIFSSVKCHDKLTIKYNNIFEAPLLALLFDGTLSIFNRLDENFIWLDYLWLGALE